MSAQKKVVIFGLGKLGELAHFYLTHDSSYEVAAFVVNEKYMKDKQFVGLPVVAFEEIERHFPPDRFQMFVAIGYKQLNMLRAQKYAEAKSKGYKLISYVSSKATCWDDTEIGENCFILENQIIQPFVKIHDDVIVWGGSHFGHNVVIGKHCWISPHAVVCGGVKIGDYGFIGANVTIRDNVSIGKECIIGAGSLILNDISDKEVYTGKPAELYRVDSEKFRVMMDISR